MMQSLLVLFLIAAALPAFAEQPPAVDPNALVIKHTEAEVANRPEVRAALQQTHVAVAGDMNTKTDRTALNQQIQAANDKYREESRSAAIRTPEEYQQFIQSHQQRFNNLNDQLRNTGGQQVQTRKSAGDARKQLALVAMTARVDNPAFPVYMTDGTSWEDGKGGKLEQRITLRDANGKRFALALPQSIQISTASCTYMPIWGELWALRNAKEIPPEANKPVPPVTQIKVASLTQIYLLNHVASAGCPFGKVLFPVNEE